jgi:hypothetical protein
MSHHAATFFFGAVLAVTAPACTRPNDLYPTTQGPASVSPTAASSHSDGGAPRDGAPSADAGPAIVPACPMGYADCDGDPQHVCETKASSDPGEPDNATCDGALKLEDLSEGDKTTAKGRILIAGDQDLFTVILAQGFHACQGDLKYRVRAKLTKPPGVALQLRGSLDPWTCSSNWSAWVPETVCLAWQSGCTETGINQVASLEVSGVGGASSCMEYALEVELCGADGPCAGCP